MRSSQKGSTDKQRNNPAPLASRTLAPGHRQAWSQGPRSKEEVAATRCYKRKGRRLLGRGSVASQTWNLNCAQKDVGCFEIKGRPDGFRVTTPAAAASSCSCVELKLFPKGLSSVQFSSCCSSSSAPPSQSHLVWLLCSTEAGSTREEPSQPTDGALRAAPPAGS